jgi:predicted NodU family carbamoyl transferase
LSKVKAYARYGRSISRLAGWLYLTAILGFKVNDDEYKVMGLASFGAAVRDRFFLPALRHARVLVFDAPAIIRVLAS